MLHFERHLEMTAAGEAWTGTANGEVYVRFNPRNASWSTAASRAGVMGTGC
jgi:hypothetical protein